MVILWWFYGDDDDDDDDDNDDDDDGDGDDDDDCGILMQLRIGRSGAKHIHDFQQVFCWLFTQYLSGFPKHTTIQQKKNHGKIRFAHF